jgi:hypothetical protein
MVAVNSLMRSALVFVPRPYTLVALRFCKCFLSYFPLLLVLCYIALLLPVGSILLVYSICLASLDGTEEAEVVLFESWVKCVDYLAVEIRTVQICLA